MERVFLSIGSNIGDRAGHIISGIEKIKQIPGLILHFISPLYKTEPVDGAIGEFFYNCAVECGYSKEPHELLENLESIEKGAGRKSKGDNSPRPLDLDIIFFGDRIIRIPGLTIPHHRFYGRRFVLVPLADLDPDFRCPKTGKTVKQLLDESADKSVVLKVESEIFRNLSSC
jgi:2-amino-4-hydroxy-6-hydroxymethyldihydropteridine diphosphokinase